MLKGVALLVIGATAVLAAPRADPPQPGDVCDMCKSVVEQFKDEQTRAQAEEMIDKVCDIMPHFLFDNCKEFTGEIKTKIESVAEGDPADTCRQVGLCPEEPKPDPSPIAHENGLVCEACKWAWETIEKSGPTPGQLKEQLNQLCLMVGPDLKEQCEQAVTQIIDQYTEGIKHTPAENCQQMQLCDPEPHPTSTVAPTPTNAAQMVIHLFKQNMGTRQMLSSNH